MTNGLSFTGTPWLDVAIALAAAIAVALVVHAVGSRIMARVFRSRPAVMLLLRHVRGPSRWILVFFAMHLVWRAADPELPGLGTLVHATTLVLIIAATAFAVAAINAFVEVVLLLNPAEAGDNLQARRLATQARVLGRTLTVFAVLFGIAAALITFPGVRQFGATLLASAGVAGLVAGLAARPVLSNVIAGLQIALTQPIRIDDVVIVEGEWGRIEDIDSAFVVVRIWDQRRLVVPLQYFIEKPFQNWTRTSSEIIGSFFLYTDYAMPVAPLREEFMRLVKTMPEWDERVASLQVTDFTDRSMQLRVIASSADAGKNWDLRCKLREGLVDFVQREYPQHLPRLRATAEVSPPASSGDPAGAEASGIPAR